MHRNVYNRPPVDQQDVPRVKSTENVDLPADSRTSTTRRSKQSHRQLAGQRETRRRPSRQHWVTWIRPSGEYNSDGTSDSPPFGADVRQGAPLPRITLQGALSRSGQTAPPGRNTSTGRQHRKQPRGSRDDEAARTSRLTTRSRDTGQCTRITICAKEQRRCQRLRPAY